MDSSVRTAKIKRASWAGITGNGILAVLKIWFGSVAGSAALVGAGIDTATDIVSSLVTLFTADIADKPPDREHPYGHGRAEAIAAKILSFIIIMAGVQLLISTVGDFFSGEAREVPELFAVYISIIAIAAKLLLFLYKMKIGRDVESQMVIADAKNMRADIVLSLSVLAGLLITLITGMPVIDSVMAVGVGIWIVRSGIGIFMESNDELMEGAGSSEIYSRVFDALKTVAGISNPHRVRIRKINTMYVIDLDIEVDGELTVSAGHSLAMKAEEVLRNEIDNLYDVIVHVEPGGNCEDQERYGLTEESLD